MRSSILVTIVNLALASFAPTPGDRYANRHRDE
jgi:hypothetical protein